MKFADERIRTADLWYQQPSLYQLRHNNCPKIATCFLAHSVLMREVGQRSFLYSSKIYPRCCCRCCCCCRRRCCRCRCCCFDDCGLFLSLSHSQYLPFLVNCLRLCRRKPNLIIVSHCRLANVSF